MTAARVVVVGATGYIGGELLRLLLGHPGADVVAAVSTGSAGRRVDGAHPNLRGLTDLCFRAPDDVPPCDVAFLAVPHGQGMRLVRRWLDRAACVVDLSADLRLRDPGTYAAYYGEAHACPALLARAVPGWPERHRAALADARLVSVPGCMANAAILALAPLADAGLLAGPVTVDGRIGSSGSGSRATALNLHAERSGALRVFAPIGHRHEAEVGQAIGVEVSMTATGIEAVRGAQVVCRVTLARTVDEAELRAVYRAAYRDEPFVRVVAQRRGLYRLPEPKILAGSNFCDVGFALAADGRRAVAVAALDNLVKGAAGNAVQCFNIRTGWPERTSLEFPGLHPA